MERWTEADYPERFDELPLERQEKLLDWIAQNLLPIQTFNTRHTSYGLKHFVHFPDGSDSYFTNGEFKGAMIRSGFKAKNEREINWSFNISERSPLFRKK